MHTCTPGNMNQSDKITRDKRQLLEAYLVKGMHILNIQYQVESVNVNVTRNALSL